MEGLQAPIPNGRGLRGWPGPRPFGIGNKRKMDEAQRARLCRIVAEMTGGGGFAQNGDSAQEVGNLHKMLVGWACLESGPGCVSDLQMLLDGVNLSLGLRDTFADVGGELVEL